jgi:hypothetical protein
MTCTKQYCEITGGKDYFEHNDTADAIISNLNPPYSLIDKWLEHTIQLKPTAVSYLTHRMSSRDDGDCGIHADEATHVRVRCASVVWNERDRAVGEERRRV